MPETNGSLPKEKVSTPEWHEYPHVFVRTLAGREWGALKSTINEEDESITMAGLCVLCVCDISGHHVFDKIEDVLDGPMAPMKRCAEAAMALNGLMEQDEGN